MGWVRRRLTDPNVRQYLLLDQGEDTVDEVHRHWIVYFPCALIALAGLGMLWLSLHHGRLVVVPFWLGVALLCWGTWRGLQENMDRFVITNMRVFRVTGVLYQKRATMPLGRILDITVNKPLYGRLIGFGHFVFESAAQEQGLSEIKFVKNPDLRDRRIQEVVQRAGLRGGPRMMN